MPRIPEYFNTETITPTDRGANAWENAARRIPSFYNSAASNERASGRQRGALFDKEAGYAREGGQINARAFKQQLWPFDMQELYDRRVMREAQLAADAEANERNPSFRVVGDINPLETAERRNARYGGGGGAGMQQMAAGAGALGNMMGGGGGSGGGGGQPDVQIQRTGQRDAGSRGNSEGGQYTIQNGEFVTMSEARKGMTQYNADRDAAGLELRNQRIDTQNYWERYNGGDPNSTIGRASNQPGPMWINPEDGADPGQAYRGTPNVWGGNPGGAIDRTPEEPSWLSRAWNLTEFPEAVAAVSRTIDNWWDSAPAASASIPRK